MMDILVSLTLILLVFTVSTLTEERNSTIDVDKKQYLATPPEPMMQAPENEELSAMDRIMQVNSNDGQYDAATNDFSMPGTDGGPPIELFEGDIVKTPHLESAVADMKNLQHHGLEAFDAINGGQWPNADVPYTFAYGFRGKTVVYNAISAFKKHTCIRFRPKTSRDRNYVQFMHGGGCSSMIGRQGGRQQISLASGCLVTGIAIHEMMHALGFFHEQSRLDRDRYITIQWKNINRAMWYNFQKYRSGHASTLGEAYDKKSVMHYGNYAFSINRRKTITSKSNSYETLGQRAGMSRIDVLQLNKYYKCEDVTGPTTGGGGGNLKNKHKFCDDIESWCIKDSYVAQNCQKTCCKDKKSMCSYWKGRNYCKGRGYDDYMKKYCPETCGYC